VSQVAIEKIDEKRPASSVIDEVRALSDRIRERAFATFERRGGGGSAMQDWLDAERQLFRIPESELLDRDGKFEARVSAPGFNPGDVKVIAMPDALIVKASSSHTHDRNEDGVRFCEFGQKTLFRRLDLPEPINVERVTANLDNGVLQVTAIKSKSETMHGQHSHASLPAGRKENENAA
jgi:HSP20 family molecular chaperone IbpA